MVLPVGARTVAMGQATVARPGIDAVFINPAGLADVLKTSLIVNHTSVGDVDTGTKNDRNSFSLIVHSKAAGAFGLTYQSVEYAPDISTDLAGNAIGENSRFISIVIASFAADVAGGWGAGLSYRLFNLNSTCLGICQVSFDDRTTQMLDAGLRYAPPWLQRLYLGASIVHFGKKRRIRNAPEVDVTPARLRAGAAYDFAHMFTKDSTVAAWLHVDVVTRRLENTSPGINIGLELSLANSIFFRAGHAASAGQTSDGGFGLGLGLKYQRFEVNVAKTITPSKVFQSDPFYTSLGITF